VAEAMDPRSQRFREAVERQDHSEIVAAFAPDAVFRSPVRYHPYRGRDGISRVFTALLETIKDYEVVDELVSGDRVGVMFRCRVGDREVEGMHLIQVGEDGLIAEYTEMARPMSGTIAMFEALAPRIRDLEAEAAGVEPTVGAEV
jgi:hypothetical protein